MHQLPVCPVVRNVRVPACSQAARVVLIALGWVAWVSAGGSRTELLPWRGDLVAAAEAVTAEPATVEAAARVLDLRTFPVIEGARVSDMRGLGVLNYEAPGEAKKAFEFQQSALQERGWKELPGAYIDAANATSKFTKNGFLVVVSTSSITGDPQKTGWSRVFLMNHGNVDTAKLPVPPGVKPFHPGVTQASYVTEAKVAETAEACRKLLLAAGWEPYGSAGSPESPMLHFKRNAIQLKAWVSTAPAVGDKTLIRYDTELLSADLPVPTDAPDPRYTDFQKTLRFDWPGEEADAVVAFYQARLPKQGWKSTTEHPVGDKKQQFLIFGNPQKDILSLDLTKYTGIVRVKLQHQTAAEVAEQDRRMKAEQQRQREELAKKNVKIKVVVPLPALAGNIEKQGENRFEFTLGTGGGPAAFRSFREHFRQAGWTEEEGTQANANLGNLRFQKGEASLRFSYIDSGVIDAEITVSGSPQLVLEPAPVLDRSRRRDDVSGNATRKPDQPKLGGIPGLPQLPAGMELPEMPEGNDLLQTLHKAAGDKPAETKKSAAKNTVPADTGETAHPAGGPVKIAEIPVPSDAEDLESSKTTKMLKLTSPSNVPTLAKFYSNDLTQKGWAKSSPGLVTDQSAILKLAKGDAALTIFINRKGAGSEVTVMCKGVEWDAGPPAKTGAKKQAR